MTSNNVIRVFISSTFEDFADFRNGFLSDVHPVLVDYCQSNGFSFHAIDLRWGINEWTANNNETLKTCLAEVKRCKSMSPKPNFILLLGNRYGWEPPAFVVPEKDMDEIVAYLNEHKDIDSVAMINSHYSLDENAVPPEYRLESNVPEMQKDIIRKCIDSKAFTALKRNAAAMREKDSFMDFVLSNASDYAKYVSDILHETVSCSDGIQKQVFNAISQEYEKLIRSSGSNELSKSIRKKMSHTSLSGSTSDEFLRLFSEKYIAALYKEFIERQIHDIMASCAEALGFTYDRKIIYTASATEQEIYEGILKEKDNCDNAYAIFVNNEGAPQNAKVEALKERVSEKLKNNICEISGNDEREKARAYECIKSFLIDSVNARVRMKSIDSYGIDEKVRQEDVLKQNIDCPYVSRKTVENDIKKAVTYSNNRFVFIHGKSGCGKTAVISHIIDSKKDIFVFCGTTACSTSILRITDYITESISRKYSVPNSYISADYNNAAELFEKALKNVPQEKSLIIYFDSIEKIEDLDRCLSSFFSVEIPKNCSVVVSSCRDASAFGLNSADVSLEISDTNASETFEIITAYLRKANRILTDEQTAFVKRKIGTDGKSPIWAYLLSDAASKWTSTATLHDEDVPTDESGMIKNRFTELSKKHGSKLTSFCLCLTACSAFGLTETELFRLLSKNKEIPIEAINEWNLNNSLPYLLYALLYAELVPYLNDLTVYGNTVITFRNDVYKDCIFDMYKEKITDTHRLLAAYFDELPYYLGKKGGPGYYMRPNVRKAIECRYEYSHANDRDALKKLNEDIFYADICIKCGMLNKVISDYYEYDDLSEHAQNIFSLMRKHYMHLSNAGDDFLFLAKSDSLTSGLCKEMPYFYQEESFDRSSKYNAGFTYYGEFSFVRFLSGNLYAIINNNLINAVDVKTGKRYRTVYPPFPPKVLDVAYMENNTVAALTEHGLQIYSIDDYELHMTNEVLTEHNTDSLLVSPDGKAAALYRSPKNDTDIKNKKPSLLIYCSGIIYSIPLCQSGKNSVSWKNSHELLIMGEMKGNVFCYDIYDHKTSSESVIQLANFSISANESTRLIIGQKGYSYSLIGSRKKAGISHMLYYPNYSSVITYPSIGFIAIAADGIAAELIEAVSGKVYSVGNYYEGIAGIVWTECDRAFTVILNTGEFVFFRTEDIISPGNVILTLPKRMGVLMSSVEMDIMDSCSPTNGISTFDFSKKVPTLSEFAKSRLEHRIDVPVIGAVSENYIVMAYKHKKMMRIIRRNDFAVYDMNIKAKDLRVLFGRTIIISEDEKYLCLCPYSSEIRIFSLEKMKMVFKLSVRKLKYVIKRFASSDDDRDDDRFSIILSLIMFSLKVVLVAMYALSGDAAAYCLSSDKKLYSLTREGLLYTIDLESKKVNFERKGDLDTKEKALEYDRQYANACSKDTTAVVNEGLDIGVIGTNKSHKKPIISSDEFASKDNKGFGTDSETIDYGQEFVNIIQNGNICKIGCKGRYIFTDDGKWAELTKARPYITAFSVYNDAFFALDSDRAYLQKDNRTYNAEFGCMDDYYRTVTNSLTAAENLTDEQKEAFYSLHKCRLLTIGDDVIIVTSQMIHIMIKDDENYVRVGAIPVYSEILDARVVGDCIEVLCQIFPIVRKYKIFGTTIQQNMNE